MSTNAETLAKARQFHQSGEITRALQFYRQALQHAPDDVDAIYPCGEAYLALSMFAEAADCFRKILQIQPSHAMACVKLGNILLARRELAEAANCYQHVLRLQPDHAEALNKLGEVFIFQEQSEQALACFQNAVASQPSQASFHLNLGKTYCVLNRSDEAIAPMRNAIRLNPDLGEAHLLLGGLLGARNEHDEARTCFEQAVRLLPRNATAHSNLGNALLSAGKHKEATFHYQEALRLDPKCVEALVYVSISGLFRLSRDQIRQIGVLLADPKMPPHLASMLHFANAHIRDRAADYDEAFEHFRQANALGREFSRVTGRAFDPGAHREFVDQLIDTFTPEYFRHINGFGLDTEVPIYIVGMPRSGTTLVEQVLSQHKKVFGAGERADFDFLVKALPDRLKTSKRYPAWAADMDQSTIRGLAEEQLHRLRALGGAASHVVDKLPLNFLHLGLIATLFPNARIIHCLRDPVDTCLSCYFHLLPAVNFAWDLADLGTFYPQYERLMNHWRHALPVRMLDVSYEELVRNQEVVTRGIVEFCGLEWDDRFLSFHRNPRPVHTASAMQVRKPIYTSSIGRWKLYKKHLQPLIDALARPHTDQCPIPPDHPSPLFASWGVCGPIPNKET